VSEVGSHQVTIPLEQCGAREVGESIHGGVTRQPGDDIGRGDPVDVRDLGAAGNRATGRCLDEQRLAEHPYPHGQLRRVPGSEGLESGGVLGLGLVAADPGEE